MTRLLALSALAACATTPVEPEGLTFASELAPPPGVPLQLDVDQLLAGLPANFVTMDADPGETVYVLYSLVGMGDGPGQCPPFMGGECVDIQAPSLLLTATAGGGGVAPATFTVPAAAPYGTEVCFQSVALRGAGGVDTVKSDVICRVTNNGPVAQWGANNPGPTYAAAYMGGPNLSYAMKYTAPTQEVAQYVEVFSGLVSGVNSLEIYTHDSVNNQPGTPVPGTYTTWTSTLNEEWQGGPLSIRHIMPQGSTWWVVWQPEQGQRASRDVGGTPVEYRGTFTGGAPWNGPFTNFEKVRFCGGGGCPD